MYSSYCIVHDWCASMICWSCEGEGAGAGAGRRAEETRRDGEEPAQERATPEGAALPDGGGPEEPAEDAGAGGETPDEDESLQETSGGGGRTAVTPAVRWLVLV